MRSRTASGKRTPFSRVRSIRLPEMRITGNVFRHIGDILSSFTSRTVQIFAETCPGGILRGHPLSAYHFWRFAAPRGLSERFWDILRLGFYKTFTNSPLLPVILRKPQPGMLLKRQKRPLELKSEAGGSIDIKTRQKSLKRGFL